MKYQRVGLHVSAAGGAVNAPDNAKELGAECFQFFSRSPRGGKAPEITDEVAKIFRAKCRKYDMKSYIHAPYYINFASKNKRIYHGSINVVREELERGSKLGVKYMMTHIGSAKDFPLESSGQKSNAAIKQTVKGLKEVFKGNTKFSTKLLLEISAGAGVILGDTFEELKYFLKELGRNDVHICLDTCHMFASGYDIRTQQALDETMKKFQKVLGLKQLKLVHVNDSVFDLDSYKDRHEHIGKGKIGEVGFKALLKHPGFQKVNFILETKHDELLNSDLNFLKKHRVIK
jgi:deoxyribonuclease IV